MKDIAVNFNVKTTMNGTTITTTARRSETTSDRLNSDNLKCCSEMHDIRKFVVNVQRKWHFQNSSVSFCCQRQLNLTVCHLAMGWHEGTVPKQSTPRPPRSLSLSYLAFAHGLFIYHKSECTVIGRHITMTLSFRCQIE